ncbi:MAG: PKD domain-containing protein [Bacteroidota bacterium]
MKTLKISFRLFTTTLICCSLALFSMSFKSATADIPQDECPGASFTVANNGCAYTTAVIFVNQSTSASSYYWDFGDGNSSTAEHPSHTYAAAGTYTVKLRAMIDGCTQEFIGTVDTIMI